MSHKPHTNLPHPDDSNNPDGSANLEKLEADTHAVIEAFKNKTELLLGKGRVTLPDGAAMDYFIHKAA
jgi:hypothetical protein